MTDLRQITHPRRPRWRIYLENSHGQSIECWLDAWLRAEALQDAQEYKLKLTQATGDKTWASQVTMQQGTK